MYSKLCAMIMVRPSVKIYKYMSGLNLPYEIFYGKIGKDIYVWVFNVGSVILFLCVRHNKKAVMQLNPSGMEYVIKAPIRGICYVKGHRAALYKRVFPRLEAIRYANSGKVDDYFSAGVVHV